ncbi:hypothetical protein [Gracilimonas sp. BCB1]|uniref:hypothetical protein n=1 Tax=Gracilimonas sp. BCB1 TaxID=3152362 RepID=UPI0032DD1E97
MITVKKLNIFEKYYGNEDGFFRFGKKKDQDALTEEEWYEIEELLRQVYLVHNDLASKELEAKLNENLNQKIGSKEAKQ